MIAYKYKLYTSKQTKHLDAMLREAAWVWNHALALQKRYYRMYHDYIDTVRLQQKWVKWYGKSSRIHSQTVQEILQRLDKSYTRFFKHIHRAGKVFHRNTYKFTGTGRCLSYYLAVFGGTALRNDDKVYAELVCRAQYCSVVVWVGDTVQKQYKRFFFCEIFKKGFESYVLRSGLPFLDDKHYAPVVIGTGKPPYLVVRGFDTSDSSASGFLLYLLMSAAAL